MKIVSIWFLNFEEREARVCDSDTKDLQIREL